MTVATETVSAQVASAQQAGAVAPLRVGRAIQARGLACRRGDRWLFRGLGFSVEPGRILWVRGRNGQGKTTLLRVLAGLSTPEEGELTWGGVPLRQAGAEFAHDLVFIAHANALKDDLTVLESLQFLIRLHGRDAPRPVLETALRRIGMHSRRDAPVRTLSQGQRRRVALARLFSSDSAPLWILDEPFDALDTEGVEALNEALASHAGAGGSVVLTSHLPLHLQTMTPTTLRLDEPAAP